MPKSFLKEILLVLAILLTIDCLAHESDVIYDDSQVLEFHITFTEEAWYDTLWQNYLDGFDTGEQEYTSATFTFNGEDYENVGVRIKGYTSTMHPNRKKPFKIKFNEFSENQEFYGVDKINLNNAFADPTFLREKILYDSFNNFIPSSRSNFVKLFVNDEYIGLYLNVEQINMRFIEKNFGTNEDGNLFKGDPYGDLVWNGPFQENYYENYELKTNENSNDWSDLLDFIYILNNLENYQNLLEDSFHIQNYLFFQTINNFFANLDSYFGNARNYYLYHRDESDKFIHIPWDFNFAFGTLRLDLAEPEDLYNLDMFWEYYLPRPLYEKTIGSNGIEEYKNIYLTTYMELLETILNEEYLFEKIDNYANLIRPAVYEDSLKMFTNEEFEINLETEVSNVLFNMLGLKTFIQNRLNSVESQLQNYEVENYISGVYINEIMADNQSTIADENGEYSDWIEIYNANEFSINLAGLFLSDDVRYPDKWQFPNVTIESHDFLIIWASGDDDDGNLHANFSLSQNGEFVGIFNKNGVTAIDSLHYPQLGIDVSYGRNPDGSMTLQQLEISTPNASNNNILLGDVDGNGEVQAFDASLTIQYSIGLINLAEWQKTAGDVDGNSMVQAFDASLILQYVIGLINEF